MEKKWWHKTVGYQIYPKSFQDTNGDGIRYVFVQNFNRNAVEIKLPVEQYPVWNGQYDGTIGSWETVVLKENSPNFREK